MKSLLLLIFASNLFSDPYQKMFGKMDQILTPAPTNIPADSIQKQANVYYHLVLLMHPQMETYHFGVHSFAKSINLKDPAYRHRLKLAHDAFTRFQAETKAKETELLQAQTNLVKKLDFIKYEHIASINSIQIGDNKDTGTISARILEMEESYWKEKQKLEETLAKQQTAFLQWRERSLNNTWMTRSERDEVLLSIRKEILEELHTLMEEQDIKIVLAGTPPSSFRFRIPFRSDKLNAAIVDGNPLRTLMDGRLLAGHHRNDLPPEQVANLRMDYLLQYQELADTLDGFASLDQNRLELTLPLLKKLWHKHKYSKVQVDSLEQSFLFLWGKK
jgi:hypothetical protein